MLACFEQMLQGQQKVYPGMPCEMRRIKLGAVEFQAGAGPVDMNESASGTFAGINAMAGYQVSRNFLLSLGTGFSVFRGTSLVPLFIDLRYELSRGFLSTFLVTDGGMLFDFSDFNKTKTFISAGIGTEHSLSQRFGIMLSTGFRLQTGDTRMNAFINLSAGIEYKF